MNPENIRDKPSVSIIVATYNQSKFIGRCLRSLLSQRKSNINFEIIVINDASTDNTDFALELFTDPRNSIIRVIRNTFNLGLPASLNRGILASKADYIVRVDSDDFVSSNFIYLLSTFLDLNPYIDAVACDYILINDEEKIIERVNCLDKPIACGIMFRKSQLLEIGLYDENFKCHEERDLRLRFEQKYKIYRVELPLYRYRRHEDNMTNDTSFVKEYNNALIDKHGENFEIK